MAFFRETLSDLSVKKRGSPPFRLFHTRPFWVNFDGITGRGLPLSGASAGLLPFLAESRWYDKKVSPNLDPGKDAAFFGGYGLIKGATRNQEIGGQSRSRKEPGYHV